MEKRFIKLDKAQDFSETINTVFSIASSHIKPLSILFFTYAIIPVLLTGLIGSFVNNDAFTAYFQTMFEQKEFVNIPDFEFLGLTMILTFISYTFISGLTYEYLIIYKEQEGENIDLKEVWNRFLKDAPTLFGYQIILSLIVGGAASILIMVFVLLASVTVAITVIGIFFLVLALIYISIPLSLVLMVKVAERKSFIDSCVRCFDLIKNHWWLTFGLLLIIGLIQSIMGSMFGLPYFIYLGFEGLTSISNGEATELNRTIMSAFNVFSTLGSSWLYILSNLLIAIHYFSQVEKKDNNSLLNRIQSISEDTKHQENL